MSQTSAIGRIECKKMTIKRKYAAPDDNKPGLVSLIYRRSGRGSTKCSIFLRADRSFRPGFQ